MSSSYPLLRTLRSLKGNQRACVLAEPLWAVPYNLFLPFVSVYMAAVGLSDRQIGAVVSFGLAVRLLWGLLSGAIADKYGRRAMMLVFGLFSWVVPCLIWAAARSYPYFLLAVFFNGMQQVINNCFSCMIVEDGDTGELVNIYTILNLIGLLAGFLAPVAGLCIDRFTLVPTMRVIYLLSAVLMTVKFLWQYRMARESETGVRRRIECRDTSVFSLAFGGWGVAAAALRQPLLLLCVVFGALLTCFSTVQSAFWPLFVTQAYGVSGALLSVFPLVTSVVSLAAYLLVTPRIRSVRRPLLAGLGAHALGLSVLLACAPAAAGALWAVLFSVICQSFAAAVLGPLYESIMSVVIPEQERARINSSIFAIALLVGTPAGWAAGVLSQRNRSLPMILNLCLILLEIAVALRLAREFQSVQGGGDGAGK